MFNEFRKIEASFKRFKNELDQLKKASGGAGAVQNQPKAAKAPGTAGKALGPGPAQKQKVPNQGANQGANQELIQQFEEIKAYVEQHKQFSDKFQKTINESIKDLWSEVGTIKQICKLYECRFA